MSFVKPKKLSSNDLSGTVQFAFGEKLNVFGYADLSKPSIQLCVHKIFATLERAYYGEIVNRHYPDKFFGGQENDLRRKIGRRLHIVYR